MLTGRHIAEVLAAALLAHGCTATVVRSYPEPLAYTRFAAQEACATAGFQLTRVESGAIEGERPVRLGLLAGQGNEHVRVQLEESAATTRVEITTTKRFFGFLASRHLDDRIAEYLDLYLIENGDLRERLANAPP